MRDEYLGQFGTRHECAVVQGIEVSRQMHAREIAAVAKHGHAHVGNAVGDINLGNPFTAAKDVHVYPAERFGEIHLSQTLVVGKTVLVYSGNRAGNIKGCRGGLNRITIEVSHVLGIKHAVDCLEVLVEGTAREELDSATSHEYLFA